MYAVGDAQHVKRVAFRLVAVDVGEAVFADVLVLRLDGVASAEKTQDLPVVLVFGHTRLVGRKRDFQITTHYRWEKGRLDVSLTVDEVTTWKRPLDLLFVLHVDVL